MLYSLDASVIDLAKEENNVMLSILAKRIINALHAHFTYSDDDSQYNDTLQFPWE